MSAPRFYFGAMSPYSWFSTERIDTVLPGAVWCPVFAGGLFKANGRTSWGLTDERAAKLAECERRARALGLGEIRWPDPWPTVDVAVARCMLFADERDRLRPFALAAMRLAFTEGHDLAEPDALREAARRADLDPDEVAAAAQDPRWKAALREATGEAVGRGVFGVPTVVVGDELYWGDDRLEDAARAR